MGGLGGGAGLGFPLGGAIPEDVGIQVFGADLLFRRRLVVGPSGDYLRVTGLDYLRQRILHRLLTAPGSFKARPEYGIGIPQLVKKRMRRSDLDEAERRAVANLLQDPQIEKATVAMTRLTDVTGRIQQPRLRVAIEVLAFGRIQRFQPFIFQQGG